MDKRIIRLDEINFRSVAIALIKNFWVVIILCVSVLMCITSATKAFYKPKYKSSATFMVSAKDSTNAYNSLTTTQSMASVFVEVFNSNVLREKIESEMGAVEFDGVINTEIIPETNLLIVSVTSELPEVAFKGLDLIVKNYHTISDYLFANAQLEVIKDPVVPTAPSNPMETKRMKILLLALTALAGIAGIVFLCAVRDTVQTPKAAKRKVDARLLRTVHHEQRNKTIRSKIRKKNSAPLITSPLISKGFIEDNLSLCSAIEYHMRRHEQKVIMVTSAGENEGKSTVTANLALALAEKNKKVLLLDCDFRKPSLHKIFENPVPKNKTLTEYLSGNGIEAADYLTHLQKYRVTLGLSFASNKNISSLINNGKLNELIEKKREEMDYIILDTPPMLAAADSEMLARLADTALLVVRTDYMHTVAINDCLDNLRKSVEDVSGFVLNNYYKTLFQ